MTRVMPRAGLPLFTLAFLALAFAQSPKTVLVVNVPATANPYLAGMPRGTKARAGDVAPDQSPVLVEASLRQAVSISFAARGSVQHAPYNPPQFDPPNGSTLTSHQGGAEHGVSDITAPINALIGVFLDDQRPDRSRVPKPLKVRGSARDTITLAPDLKQVFFIGAGVTRRGDIRKISVPKGATRLFLGVMDGYEWNNNQGGFVVQVTIERTDVSSNMFSVDSRITFAEWACLPERSQCTPDRPVISQTAPGHYHVILPAHMEWGARIPVPSGTQPSVNSPTGTVCLDSQSRSTSSCNGPQGNGPNAGAGYLSPGAPAGALVARTENGQIYFSVNDRSGPAFEKHEGYFEFDVTMK